MLPLHKILENKSIVTESGQMIVWEQEEARGGRKRLQRAMMKFGENAYIFSILMISEVHMDQNLSNYTF